MTHAQSQGSFSRRTALTGLGAGGLGLALAARGHSVVAQEASPAAVEVATDVIYGEVDGQQLLLDIALPPNDAADRPAVVLIHGGGFVVGDKAGLLAPLTAELAQAGYVTFNINYRLFGDDGSNAWPAQLDDAQRAVRWIRANATTYGVDPERIASLGHSSGGQLAAFLGTRDTRDNADSTLAEFSSRVTCAVDISGNVDATIPFADEETNAVTVAILGGTADAPPSDEALRDFSPIAFVDEHTVPFAILHGLADIDCPIENSRTMTDALHEAGVEVLSAELAGLTHMVIVDWSIIGPITVAFLERQLHPGT